MAFANTIGGASTGATAGSALGPWGTLGGAIIGGGLGAAEDIWGGGNQQLGTLRPEQQSLQNALINLIQMKLSGQGGLSPIAQNAMQRFNTQTVPGLAERFTSLGAGSQGSSAFSGALGAAGGDLQNQLAGIDWQEILKLLGPALSQSYENIMQKPVGFGASSTKAIPDILKYLAASKGEKPTPNPSTGNVDISHLNPANYNFALNQPTVPKYDPLANLQRLGGVR